MRRMSDDKQQQQQQQQTGIRGTSAKTVVVKVNPLTFDDNHGLVKLVKQPLSKINLLEELKDDDVINNINKLKQFEVQSLLHCLRIYNRKYVISQSLHLYCPCLRTP